MTEPIRLDRAFPPIAVLAGDLRQGRLSVAGLLTRCIERWMGLGDQFPAFVDLDVLAARTQATQLDRELSNGHARGPLHGIPVAIKDNIAVAGSVMAAGSGAYRQLSTSDARVVCRLREAGALVLGRTRMHELAFGATGTNPHDGGVPHPFSPSRVPGGSSSGSAVAVASGVCPIALGTDTGGSVRMPAALCGIVGFKPTQNLLSLEGVLPLSQSLDHVGVLARFVEDVRVVLDVLAPLAPVTKTSAGSLAILEGTLESADNVVLSAFENALHRLKEAGLSIARPRGPSIKAAYQASGDIIYYEAYRNFSNFAKSSPAQLSHDLRARLEAGSKLTHAIYVESKRLRKRTSLDMSRVFGRFDAVIGPTVPIVAPTMAASYEPKTRATLSQNTRLFNFIGWPAITLPIGHRQLGIGFQMASAPGTDAQLLAMANRIARVLSR